MQRKQDRKERERERKRETHHRQNRPKPTTWSNGETTTKEKKTGAGSIPWCSGRRRWTGRRRGTRPRKHKGNHKQQCCLCSWRGKKRRDDGEQKTNKQQEKSERNNNRSHRGQVLKGKTEANKKSLLRSENADRTLNPGRMRAKTPKRNQRS